MSKKTIIFIAFLLFSLIASLGLVFRTTIFYGKATYGNTSPVALENSYLFASPIQAQADGKEKIRITVFLLDGRGMGVVNQSVTLNLPSPLISDAKEKITDDVGKVTFDISSITAGKFPISASANGQSLSQKVSVLFN